MKDSHQRKITAIVFAAMLLTATAAAAAERYNFVVITIDDLQWQTFGHLDSRFQDYTPFLTEYAKTSFTFRNSYVPYSLCTPTRASLMTGLVPHRHGVTHHHRSIFAGVTTLPDALKQSGYYNGLIGKVRHTLVARQSTLDYVVGPDHLAMGRSPQRFHEKTTEFLAAAGQKPFFLNINIHDPHTPYPGTDAADKWKSYVQFLADRSGVASILGSARLEYQGTPPSDKVAYDPAIVPVYPFIPDLPAVREEMSQILTAANRADQSVAAIISALENSGVAQKTAVFIFSDNGAALPFAKEGVYVNSLRAGLIIQAPWLQRSLDQGVDALISINDIYPTVLDLAGVDYDSESIDGKSLAGLLTGTTTKKSFREYLVGYHYGGYPQRSISDGEFWYIWNPWSDGSTRAHGHFASSRAFAAMREQNGERFRFLLFRTPEELYNIAVDENSQLNLVGRPEHAARLGRLRQALLDDMGKKLDPMLDEFKQFIGQGQVVLRHDDNSSLDEGG